MTSSESTSRPRSQTALTKRSTRTVVFPVPAPAETKTTPGASMAAACSGFGRVHGRLTRHIGARSHQEGQPPSPSGSCATSPERIRPTNPRACSARPVDLAPELVLVAVVVLLEAGDAVVARRRPQEPARRALPGEGAIEPAERLDPDEVAQDEHVERDLEAQLGVDLRRREGRLAGLVVPHDPARAERVEVDPVDLPREREAAQVEAALQLRRRALGPERDLEAARDERGLRFRLVAHEALEVAPELAVAARGARGRRAPGARRRARRRGTGAGTAPPPRPGRPPPARCRPPWAGPA